MKVSFKDFSLVYFEKVKSVYKFWNTEMQMEVGKHNIGWAPPTDFLNYLNQSVHRYYTAYCDIQDNATAICDVGGFWGVFPLTLKELGFKVTMTEALKYYSTSFNLLFDYIRSAGVTIIDIDPFESKFEDSSKFDFVTIMAVLEHYPHSLSFFLQNVNSIISPNGRLYIEVPNIAYLLTRLKLMLGISPLVSISSINKSATPFTGHHHEYTMAELQYLIEEIKLKLVAKHYYNYSFNYNAIAFILKRFPYTILFNCFPNTREIVSICGEKKSN